MRTFQHRSIPLILAFSAMALVAGLAVAREGPGMAAGTAEPDVLRGRFLVVVNDCGACHGGVVNPAVEGWLAGSSDPEMATPIGPFTIYAANLTPDEETGIGRYTERQIFNAIRYGLRPAETPDVEITSTVPGEGNHPANPSYLAPAMPWAPFRHLPDQDIRDIAAYLKRGLEPVHHAIPQADRPEDQWAGEATTEKIGVFPAPPFPTAHEQDIGALGNAPVTLEQVLRGRALVIAHACAACHGMAFEPSMEGWLVGMRGPEQEFPIGPFKTRPRNITPDNATGIGRFTERQLFNALRYGLRPGETPDVEITSTVPGQGNHPLNPKYLAPPMPWPAFRHRSDEDLWAIVAYLKYAVAPVEHRVEDSEGPPDFWASTYAEEPFAAYPLPPFPTERERAPE
jgi:mono/diheme cytochrome c family protein